MVQVVFEASLLDGFVRLLGEDERIFVVLFVPLDLIDYFN